MGLNKTQIEWAQNPDGTPGYTWNPITGCLKGCDYCYARRLANTRLKELYLANENICLIHERAYTTGELKKAYQDPFYPRFWPEKIMQPESRKKPAGIFVCDMSDLFGIGIPERWTESVIASIRRSPQHRFYLLTKQPQNLIKFSPFPDNCWVGVTATDTVAYSIAVKYLQVISAKVKYLSIEPMQSRIITNYWELDRRGIQWVIIGAQTKPYKPPKIEWVREIIEACDKAGIPVFLKENLKPLFKDSKQMPNLRWWGSVFGLRQELPK